MGSTVWPRAAPLTVALAYAVMCFVAGNVKFANYLQVPFVSGSGEFDRWCARR